VEAVEEVAGLDAVAVVGQVFILVVVNLLAAVVADQEVWHSAALAAAVVVACRDPSVLVDNTYWDLAVYSDNL
jgi:hypothetical protein